MSSHNKQVTEKNGKTILVVDDNPDTLRTLKEILEQGGYNFRAALNGTLSLQSAQASLPDLILLDIKMPGIDGFEVCARLKSDERTRNVPVIFISALDETSDKVRAFETGGIDYITKPFQSEEILSRVRAHLVTSDILKNLESQNIRLEQEILDNEKAEVLPKSDTGLESAGRSSIMGEFQTRHAHNNQPDSHMIQLEKMLTLGGLAAGIAHEISNPLSGILQNLQVLRNRLSGNLPKNRDEAEACGISFESIESYMRKREILEIIETLIDSGRMASDIVGDMLSFSRNHSPNHVPIDLTTLLDKSVRLAEKDYNMKKGYDFRDIEIIRLYDENMPHVSCNCQQIQQVFLNILLNCAQAMAEDRANRKRPKSCLTLRAKYLDGTACIEIEDNGPGMEENILQNIFEPFFTTKKLGEGTGLGLWISHFIITQRHGGKISVESTPGKGSIFFIQLNTKQ